MLENQRVERDERTEAVEGASYGLAYKLVAFALLLDVAYRSFFLGQAAWDLLAIVIVSGLAITAYQWRGSIISRGWARALVVAISVAFVVAVSLAVLLPRLW